MKVIKCSRCNCEVEVNDDWSYKSCPKCHDRDFAKSLDETVKNATSHTQIPCYDGNCKRYRLLTMREVQIENAKDFNLLQNHLNCKLCEFWYKLWIKERDTWKPIGSLWESETESEQQ